MRGRSCYRRGKAEDIITPDGGVNALSGLRDTHCIAGPVSYAPPGKTPDGGVNALSGLRIYIAGPVSDAPPGKTPDGGVNALSGLRDMHCRPGKRRATGQNLSSKSARRAGVRSDRERLSAQGIHSAAASRSLLSGSHRPSSNRYSRRQTAKWRSLRR